MNRIHVGVGVVNQTPFAWDQNRANILGAITDARAKGISVLCLPELCITGYGCEDMFHAPWLVRRAASELRVIAEATEGMVVSVGLPVLHRGAVYNAAALLVDGQIAGLAAKRFLAGDGIHYEPRWFKPWPERLVTTIDIAGGEYPLGDLTFDVGGVVFGFEICEDAWVAMRPGGRLSLMGVDVILNPSASHFAFGKQDIRRRLVLEGSRAFGVAYLYANLLGNEAGRSVYDGGAMIASAGAMVAESPRFSFGSYRVEGAVVDVEHSRLVRARSASFRPDPAGGEATLEVDFSFPEEPPTATAIVLPPWENGPDEKEEEFTRTVALALFDYLRKSRAQGYVVSLSGGADSAAVSCLVRLMVDLASAELGLDGIKERLGHVKGLAECPDVRSMTKRLLTTLYQATKNSGDVTLGAAAAVAEAIGSDHYVLDVDALVTGYVSMIEGAIERELGWASDDIALQNIQARVRGPSAWLLANLRSQILLATSNRSEAAVGYATMDGDTCGGVSPIAGIDKAFLRSWLTFMEKQGPHGLAPIPELRAVNVQAPTAELRPQEAAQTDEGDLMPYPLLDAIERAAIRDKKGPVEAFHRMRLEFPQYDVEQLHGWVTRFFRLWSYNQWKRERYAPSFHLDDENLDPKTWCRFPILSGGYAAELRDLDALVSTL